MTVGGLAALGIALGGNLGGLTSFLLGLDGGQLAERLRLDIVVPVKGFKRCVDYNEGFEFSYPASWLADQTLVQRAAQRAEQERGLDPPSLRAAAARRRTRNVVEPVAAFGPPGSSGELNCSAIVAPIYEGFQLRALGSPQEAAQRFLDTTAAPPGSDKTALLLAAEQRTDAAGQLYYWFEFVITAPRFTRHNVAVLTARDDLLYTFNCQSPEERWQRLPAVADQLRTAAKSFRLIYNGKSS